MPDERVTLNAHVCALISKVGGVEAAAAVLEARWGRPYSKGTISQKKNGHLDWTVVDVIGLQEAAGMPSVTGWLVSLDEADDAVDCVTTAIADFARESGEAVAAVLSARTPEQRARAVKELNDVNLAADRITDALEAGA